MTKVVINSCYGGFSLSTEAKREYLRRTNQTWTEEPSDWALVGNLFYVGARLWTERDLDRTDSDLIAVVEAMGEAAAGEFASLKVVDVPEGTLYRISEYDGYEGIETRDGVDWSTA